jgi:Fe-S-cluster containining protein
MHSTETTHWAPQRYFFDRGLRFACTRCGRCCTGAPGIVYLTREAVLPLAQYLGLSETETSRRYLAPWRDGHTIREDAEGRCLFYKDGCTIYPVRPAQCRTWPFWLTNLRSRVRWERVVQSCPGIGRGRHYSREEILDLLSSP